MTNWSRKADQCEITELLPFQRDGGGKSIYRRRADQSRAALRPAAEPIDLNTLEFQWLK